MILGQMQLPQGYQQPPGRTPILKPSLNSTVPVFGLQRLPQTLSIEAILKYVIKLEMQKSNSLTNNLLSFKYHSKSHLVRFSLSIISKVTSSNLKRFVGSHRSFCSQRLAINLSIGILRINILQNLSLRY